MSFFRHSSRPAVRDTTDDWTQEADSVSLRRLDEIGGHPRPSNVGVTYAEQEFHALAEEQERSWPAEGEREARSFQARARGLDRPTNAIDAVLVESKKEVELAHADYQHAARVLTPYQRREPAAKLRYWIGLLVLWFGDAAGISAAAITSGEIPANAAGQAFAAGIAAVFAGLVGSELKDLRMARTRQRDPKLLTKDEQRYQRLFLGSDNGMGIVKLVAFLSFVVVGLLGVGIFALRSSIEGSLAGVTFGLLAAATAIGSMLLSYSTADDVADLLATMAKRTHRAEKRYLRLAAAKRLRLRAEADEIARSIQAEYKLRGEAAAKRAESLAWRVQRRNPQVLGHGFPAGDQGGVIGRRARRNGAK